MSNNLQFAILLIALFLFFVVFIAFAKGRMPLKYALIWWVPVFIILVVAIFPKFLELVTTVLGFQTISNMTIGLLFVVLIYICISLTIIVSGQKTKITLLVQELSILKSKFEESNKKEK